MADVDAESIKARYEEVLEKVAKAWENRRDELSSRSHSAKPVRVVVVTKMRPVETLEAALKAGVTDLGENYAEEAAEKMRALGLPGGVRWHMIGHVQSRKAALVASNFDMLHSLDSGKLATRLDRFAGQAGQELPVLMECNVSGESSKYGYPAWDESQWPALGREAEAVSHLPNLALRGLMTMPPYAEDPEASRPFFRRLVALREYLRARVATPDWRELSMGTSADFTVAVEEGATLVRIGTAILGPRGTV